MLSRIPAKVSWLGNACAVLAVIIMFVMMGHMLLETFLRAVFNSGTDVLEEFVGYYVAAITFLALGRTAEQNAHIRINLIHSIAPEWLKKTLDLFAIFVTILMSCGVAWFIGRSTLRNYTRDRLSDHDVPLWIPESIILLGLAMFILVLLSIAIRILRNDNPLAAKGGH